MLKKFKQFITEDKIATKRVFCDLDGVLVDFKRGFKRLKSNPDHLTPIEYDKKHGKNSIWKLIDDRGSAFWEKLPWTKDGRELWDYLSRYNPTILTSPSRGEHSVSGKTEWVKRNLNINEKPVLTPDRLTDESHLIIAKDKYLFAKSANDILIDDNHKKLEDWAAAGGTSVFHNDSTDTIRVLEEIFTNLKD